MLEEEVIFLLQEGIQKEGFNNLWKSKMSGGDHILSSSKQYEGFDVDEEITIWWMVFLKMNPVDTGVIFLMILVVMALWKKVLILWVKGGMKKEMAKKIMNELIMKIEEGIFASYQKVGVLGEVWNVSLWMMLGSLLQVAM